MSGINPLSSLKVALLSAFIVPLQNIVASFANIEANPTIANVTSELAVLQGQQLTLALELPALVPTLEGDAIALAASEVQLGLNKLISDINAQITAATATPAVVPATEKAEGKAKVEDEPKAEDEKKAE